MNIIESMYKRRSIREYKAKPVEREKIKTLLQAAMAAPSANNKQPWHFLVVDKADGMKNLRDIMPYGKYNAPAAIIICGYMNNPDTDAVNKYWIQDCTSALMNILNAAVELDLGTVWLGLYPKNELVETVKKQYNIPESITPMAVVYVGYADEDKQARTQFDENKITYQKWD